MFSTILKQILKELAAISLAFCMQLDKNIGAPQRSQLLAFIYCVEFAFYEPILELGKNVNVFKMLKCFLVRESFHWKTNLGCSVHRWSTCNAWQHIWFGCSLEGSLSACHDDSLPSVPACGITGDSASSSERSSVHCRGKIDLLEPRTSITHFSMFCQGMKEEYGLLLLHVSK